MDHGKVSEASVEEVKQINQEEIELKQETELKVFKKIISKENLIKEPWWLKEEATNAV